MATTGRTLRCPLAEGEGSLQRQRAGLGVRRLGFQLVSVALEQAHHLSSEWARTTFHQLPQQDGGSISELRKQTLLCCPLWPRLQALQSEWGSR